MGTRAGKGWLPGALRGLPRGLGVLRGDGAKTESSPANEIAQEKRNMASVFWCFFENAEQHDHLGHKGGQGSVFGGLRHTLGWAWEALGTKQLS